jgi:tRNA pseudouridine55 synthase
MERPYLIDKPLGATPLEALEALRTARSIPASVKLAYAGRLDPLATGLLPVLHGAQLSRQEEYWHLPKQYAVSVLLGITTDSYDLLGMPRLTGAHVPDVARITATVRGMVGKIDLSVPVYSSHRLEGRPMFDWARSSEDGPPVVPVRRMTISQIDSGGMTEVSSQTVRDTAVQRVRRVRGDFRQDAICAAWEQLLQEDIFFTVINLDVQCASGTYIRSVAHEIGRRLGAGAVVSDLRRTRVASWRVTDPDVIGIASPQ